MVTGKAARGLVMGGLSALMVLALAPQAALAASPGFPAAPGEYHSSTEQAFFFSFSPSQSVFIGIVDQSDEAVLTDGSRTATHAVKLFVNLTTADLNAFDCYLIAPDGFSFTSGHAAVQATVDGGTQSCPGQTNTLPTPFTVAVTWTGTSPIAQTRGGNTFTCGSHVEKGTSSSTIQTGSAEATMSPILSGSVSAPDHQRLQSFESRLHADGVLPDGCNSVGGIACEPAFPNAGQYTNTSTTADAFLESNGSFVSIRVARDAQSYSECLQQPPVNDFYVRVSDFGGPDFSEGCFVLGPSDFSNNGVQGASLNVVLTDLTPTCFGQPARVTLPLTLDLAWSATSPTAQFSSTGSYDCATYRAKTKSSDMGTFDTVSATAIPLLSGPVTMQGSLDVRASAVDAEGAKQQGCVTVTGLPI